MLDSRLMELLSLLDDDQYHTALSLAQCFNLSDKTIRTLIKALCGLLRDKDFAQIEAKHGMGYKLVVSDRPAFENFKGLLAQKIHQPHIPNTSRERVQYLMDYLLNSRDYVKIGCFQEMLFVSRNTLSADIKEVERELSKFNLKLARKPNKGIRVVGKEFNIRLCLANYIAKGLLPHGSHDHSQSIKMKEIAHCLLSCLKEQNITLSEFVFQNLIIHIYVALRRMEAGDYVPLDQMAMERIHQSHEYEAATKIVNKLQQHFSIPFPPEEISYIAIHLAGKRIFSNSPESESNIVINQEINEMAGEMIQQVYESFCFDFRDNLELRMSLCQHLLALDIRVRYDMNLENPLLDDIKRRLPLAYAMAGQACTVINKHYGKRLRDDEIGYIALSFALALERQRTQVEGKNILLVCATGKGSAKLMAFKFQEEFGRYIHSIKTCDVWELEKVDFAEIDYVFTTVPIGIKIPVPIMEVQYFLDDAHIQSIKNALVAGGKENVVVSFFSRNLFIPNLDCKSKYEAIQAICAHVKKYIPLQENFYELVMKREELARTEFGNLVAIPHPYEAIDGPTFVSVAVLKDKILWDEREVQVVFLVAVAKNHTYDLQHFYEIVAKFLLSEGCINELIREKSYDTLIQRLLSIEKGGAASPG